MIRQTVKAAVPALLSWYELHARSLPWRIEPSPYRVWISEIMLQQTRIEAVIPHYRAFLQRMPQLRALAEISETELLKYWEGLGYYSRARNLQKAAKAVIDSGREALPETYAELIKLPGIGEYTAGAIASISFNECVPAVDGNVMRVLARLTGCYTDVLSPEGKKHFTKLAAELIPENAPGQFNQAVMELGETVCLPNTTPKCEKCPLSEVCVAHQKNITDELPVRKKLKARKIQPRTVFLLCTSEQEPRILLHRRPKTGLLAGLYEFPGADGNLTEKDATSYLETIGIKATAIHELPESKHIFTHIEWHMTGYAAVVKKSDLPAAYCWVTKQELFEKYAIPSAFRMFSKFISQNI